VQMVRLDAALRGRRAVEKAAEDLAVDSHPSDL
jgi:hypothetical protein